MFGKASACGSAAALAAVLCAVGCATTFHSSGGAPSASDQPIELTAAEQRKADALAEYATGYSAEIRGDLDDALEHYSRVVQYDPHNTALAIRIGQIYATKHDITNAVSVLQSALQSNPDDAELAYWLGFVYRSDNQNDNAAVAFHTAVKSQPSNLNALGGLLEILILQDSEKEAIRALDRAFRQNIEAGSYWSRLGDFYAIVHRQKPTWSLKIDRKRIQQCYEKALKFDPGDTDVELRLADAYTDNGDYQKSADLYAKLLAANPDTPLIRERLAANYIRADQKQKAIAVLEEIIKREPLAFAIYNDLGELYGDENNTEKAISNYQQSLVIRPNQPEIYAQITALQLDSQKTDDALKTLGTWKDKFPTDFRVPYFTGLIQTDRKQYTNAVASFADAETLARESPDQEKLSSKFYFSYGAACERAGDADKAVTLFRKCLELDPEDPIAANYLGYMWAEKGTNLQEALGLIQKAVKLDPKNGAYLDSLGWVLFKLGRNDEALVQMRRAVALMKDDAVVLDHLAEVLLKAGKTDEAINILSEAHKIEPNNKDISGRLQQLKGN
ncbi:MAG TPA: tetratricopeptide repeat protein [Verrucomicrobiae bacterium]|nr:tetratricopeptide repeat protein [Verrucomicrobiae bacterium]